ncbi:uncharacterized protein PRCAT00000870001 [Priceomyces carsonii]|uniref:uncharacterized protein n=1 Tax=Priceomyces carsonii TaxID=28549 RepID=UPI002EDAA49B|nr:unnamed protein product [Priceomyces carsonii]
MSDVYFYKYLVTRQVFFRSKFTYALVNIKPIVPGHVLIVPLRESVLRFGDLSSDESRDYMDVLQLIHKFIIHVYKADSLNIAIQDGPEAGQSVPHLHTHLIPRYKSDGFGDNIYKMLEKSDIDEQFKDFFKRKQDFKEHGGFVQIKDSQRVPRTIEDMEKEAKMLKEELSKFRC